MGLKSMSGQQEAIKSLLRWYVEQQREEKWSKTLEKNSKLKDKFSQKM